MIKVVFGLLQGIVVFFLLWCLSYASIPWMKDFTDEILFPLPTPTPTPQINLFRLPDTSCRVYATAICCDGSISYSSHRQGTCSHHGGVCTWSPCR